MKYAKQLGSLRAQLAALKNTRSTERYASDRVAFAEDLLGLELDPWQAGVIGARRKRDILNCSRQAGKSTTAAVLGLHEALYVPDSLTILVSPTQRQSGELFRKLITFRDTLPVAPELSEDNKLSMSVKGGGRVVSLPGSEATIRGYSAATLVIEDEASRVDDGLHMSVKPMLSTTNGRYVLMSTPFGKRGHFWEIWNANQGWARVEIPATQVKRISPEFLEEERRTIPEFWFLQEYMCQFMEAEDAVFRYDDVMRALTDEVTPLFGG